MTTPAVNGELLAALGARERFGALALLAAFALFGLFDHGLWSANDTREGAMIAEMARTGDWTLPRLNGAPYLEKPPLLHWTGALLCRLAGTVNEGLVRLPAALYGFGTLLLVWRLGRRLGLERAGLLAACLCATSLLFAEYTRVVLTDAALMFMVLLALDLFWSAYTAAAGRRIRYLLFLLAAAAAFYAKGLLGPGFIWLSVGLFLLLRREGGGWPAWRWPSCRSSCWCWRPGCWPWRGPAGGHFSPACSGTTSSAGFSPSTIRRCRLIRSSCTRSPCIIICGPCLSGCCPGRCWRRPPRSSGSAPGRRIAARCRNFCAAPWPPCCCCCTSPPRKPPATCCRCSRSCS